MGYVELPDQPPAGGGKLQGTIELDKDELTATVSLLKEALAELTRGMANGVGGSTLAPPAAAPVPQQQQQAPPRPAPTTAQQQPA